MPLTDASVEEKVISTLKKHRRPIDPDRIFVALRQQNDELDNSIIRAAVWRLIATDKIELTSARQLRSKPHSFTSARVHGMNNPCRVQPKVNAKRYRRKAY